MWSRQFWRAVNRAAGDLGDIVVVGGTGNLASSVLKSQPARIQANIIALASSETNFGRLDDTSVHCTTDPEEAFSKAKMVCWSSKPADFFSIAKMYSPFLPKEALHVSFMAAVTLEQMEKALLSQRLIRTMSNLLAARKDSDTAIVAHPSVDKAAIEEVLSIFRFVGRVHQLDSEQQMNMFTAAIGSGPAFVLRFMESFRQALVGEGFREEQAIALIASLFTATGSFADNDQRSWSQIIDDISSARGTTVEGLGVLDHLNAPGAVTSCLHAASYRAAEISRELDEKAGTTP